MAVSGNEVDVLWLKRDVRVFDNEALFHACLQNVRPLLILYVYDRLLWSSNHLHESHLKFVNQGLVNFEETLRTRYKLDTPVYYRVGLVEEVLGEIHRTKKVVSLYTSCEVMDRAMRDCVDRARRWSEACGVEWVSFDQTGISSSAKRDGWAKRWKASMQLPIRPMPQEIRVLDDGSLHPGFIVEDPRSVGLQHFGLRPEAQKGGEEEATKLLESFLSSRGMMYSKELSSPVTAWEGCSRLSTYLAWGHVSLRRVFQAVERKAEELRQEKKQGRDVGPWLKSLSAFGARLRWRSHFMQKLHDEPSIEDVNMCRAYDQLYDGCFDESLFLAWIEGRTGFPMVDACMRALHASGWINFRMRAMLVSFACYFLWLDWRRLTPAMARLFLDYEPGIHFPQFQMQAGTTGINANRIYSPAKQVMDHDPRGVFIRKYVPELEMVPDKYIAEPDKMPEALQKAVGCEIGKQYPAPIVDYKSSYAEARRKLASIRSRSATRKEASAVYEKHGSRKRNQRSVRPSASKRAKTDKQQLPARDGGGEAEGCAFEVFLFRSKEEDPQRIPVRMEMGDKARDFRRRIGDRVCDQVSSDLMLTDAHVTPSTCASIVFDGKKLKDGDNMLEVQKAMMQSHNKVSARALTNAT